MYNHEYIRSIRQSKGLTILAAAELLQMDRGNYNRMELGGYKNIPIDLLVKLHEILGLDLYYLLNIRKNN